MKNTNVLMMAGIVLFSGFVSHSLAATTKSIVRKPVKTSTLKVDGGGSWNAKLLSSRWIPSKTGTSRKRAPQLKILSRSSNLLKFQSSVSGLKLNSVKIGSNQYKQIRIPGAGLTTRVGTPELPVIKKHIQVPFGQRASVKNIKSKAKIMNGIKVYPVQPQPEDSKLWKKGAFRVNKGAYTSKAWTPKSIVKIGDYAIVRGQQIATVFIYPVQYNAAQKQVRLHSNITYDIVYTGKKDIRRIAKSNKRFSPVFTIPLQREVINFTVPRPEEFILRPPVNREAFNLFTGCDYLIITADAFYNSLTPLVNHKTSKGLIVKRIKLSQIGPNPSAEKIRTYIRNYYIRRSPSPTYVLLVGDTNLIRTHYKTNHTSNSELSKKTGTDLYYGCVDGNDIEPDLFVGRFPAKTTVDVNNMVAKTITFENDIANDAPWTRKMLMAAYFQDHNRDGQADRAYVQTIERIYNFLKNKRTEGNNSFSLRRVYEDSVNSPDENKTYKDGSAVANDVTFSGNPGVSVRRAINNNVGFVFHRDHGDSRNGPGGGIEGWDKPRFTARNVRNLTNTKPGVYFSINCRTGWYDGETDKDSGGTIVDSLAEALFRKASPQGAAAVIGASRISPSYPNNDLTLGIVEAMYPGIIPRSASNRHHKAIYNLGPALVFAKNYVRQMWGGLGDPTVVTEYEMYNIMGDPDLQIRYKRPSMRAIINTLHRPWLPKVMNMRPHKSLTAIKIKPQAYNVIPKTIPRPIPTGTSPKPIVR